MTGWRFAFSRRWAGYLALVIVFAIVCSLLGMWQFARRAEARVEIDRVEMNYDAEPRAVDDVLTSLDAWRDDLRWTPVLLEGEYLVDDELLVRNRTYGGRPGFEVLVPLLLDDGTVFVVNRGWVPTGSQQDAPDAVPAPPSGRVEVVARLKAGEPSLSSASSIVGDDQLRTIRLPAVAALLERPTYTGAFGEVAAETPAVTGMPFQDPKPEPDEGPHLSYALQWFVFALMAFVAFGWALRQEYRAVNADDPEERERAEERHRRRAAKPLSDAEIEDAILESSER